MIFSKKEQGFAQVELILFLILITLIGYVGWKTFIATDSKDGQAEPSWQIVDSSQPSKKQGYIDYQNQTLGFRMTYPKTWGKVEAQKGLGPSPQFEQGVGYLLKFTDYDRVTLSAVTKTWMYSGADYTPGCRATGFTEFNRAKLIDPTPKYYGRMLIDKSDLWVAESISTDITKAVLIDAKKAYKSNKMFAGVALTYCDTSIDVPLSDESAVAIVGKYKENPGIYLPKIDREELLTTINSISELPYDTVYLLE